MEGGNRESLRLAKGRGIGETLAGELACHVCATSTACYIRVDPDDLARFSAESSELVDADPAWCPNMMKPRADELSLVA